MNQYTLAEGDRGSPTLSLVIPAFNEADGIVETMKSAQGVLTQLTDQYEIIVVDDGSTDQTWQRVQTFVAGDNRLKPIRFTRNFGKEAAILAGLECSRGRAVVVMDGDMQHPPELIGEMFKLWDKEDYLVVHATKERRQCESTGRRMFSHLFYRIMRSFSGFDLQMGTDFKLLDRSVVEQYLRLPENLKFFRGLIPWLGFKSTSVKFTPASSSRADSRWSFPRLIRMGVRAICTFSSLPMQVVTILGGLVFIASFIMGVDTFYMKLSGKAVAGFSTVILLLLFIGSVLMFSLGVIGQYLALIYEEIKKRPPYIIEKTENTGGYRP